MSKIGKQPIIIPSGVTVTVGENSITVKGPKGELVRDIVPNVVVEVEGESVIVKPKDGDIKHSAFWGLMRALIANMVEGVVSGFEKILEFTGVGYKAIVQGDNLELSLGFSHTINVKAPQGITFESDKSSITIRGIDKEAVGQIAAEIRSYRKPEPYKGKGIRYKGEHIRRKVGKKAAGTA
ncbi:MAG: 50S ribosomal protein L6 [Parcubacteria group bacterium]